MMDTIGGRIREKRKFQNMTQETLAKKADISVMSLRRYETGERQVTLETLQKIAGALEVKVSDLLYDSPATSFSEMNKRLLENGVTKNWIINHSEEDQANMDLIEANYCIADKKGKQDIVEYSQMVADRTLKQRKQNGDPGKE